MFIDRARIYLKSATAATASSVFGVRNISQRSPAGGDGGRGGSIYFIVDGGLSTLMNFRYRRKFVAPSGEAGGSKNQAGKDGEDLFIKVPPGTLVKDVETGEVLLDLTVPGTQVLVLPGGRGGRGTLALPLPPGRLLPLPSGVSRGGSYGLSWN